MKLNFKILRIFLKTKFVFSFPKKTKILIYDGERIDLMYQMLKNFNPEILYIRYEKINLPILILSFFKRHTFPECYIDTYIEYCSPDLVITNIDNDIRFLSLSLKFKDIQTVFIQNGWRDKYQDIFETLSKINCKEKKQLFVDYKFVFGKQIGEFFSKYVNGKTKVLGSFINNHIKKKTYRKNNLLAYISQYNPNYEGRVFNIKNKNVSFFNFIKKTDMYVLPFLQNYSIKNKKELVIIPNSQKKDILSRKKETNYFKSILNSNFRFLEFNSNYTSYLATDYSSVTVTIDSTLGYEALSRKNRVAFFSVRGNFVGFKDLNKFGWPTIFDDNGLFWTNKCNYNKFKIILNTLYTIKSEEWYSELKRVSINNIIVKKNNKLFLRFIKNKIKS